MESNFGTSLELEIRFVWHQLVGKRPYVRLLEACWIFLNSFGFSRFEEGLDYLHTREPAVIHRDIKGSNILIGDGALAVLASVAKLP